MYKSAVYFRAGMISLIMLVLAACGAGSKSINIPPSSFALKLQEKITYAGLSVTLTEVRESRCPIDADCVRAGEAIAVFNVRVNEDSERNIQLCEGADCAGRGLGDRYPFSVGSQQYLFKLDSIRPDPSKTSDRPETKVYFSISLPK